MQLLRFRVPLVVGEAYRQFAKTTFVVFHRHAEAHRNVRSKIKFMIRENPLNHSPDELAEEIRALSELFLRGLVQAAENPTYGSLQLNLRRENVVDGTVSLPRIPKQTFLRAERYMKNLLANAKGHPNAEVVPEPEDVARLKNESFIRNVKFTARFKGYPCLTGFEYLDRVQRAAASWMANQGDKLLMHSDNDNPITDTSAN